MRKVLILLLVSFTAGLKAQSLSFIHKKNNAYLRLYENKNSYSFQLIEKKGDSCLVTWEKKSKSEKETAIKLLKLQGWTIFKGYKDCSKHFTVSLALDSVATLVVLKDTSYKVFYKIIITNKAGISTTISSYDRTTRLAAFESAIKNKTFGIGVAHIKHTGIYELTLSSVEIFDSDLTSDSYRNGILKAFYF